MKLYTVECYRFSTQALLCVMGVYSSIEKAEKDIAIFSKADERDGDKDFYYSVNEYDLDGPIF